ncbi:MAG: Plug domain-containing protein, partial [Cyclobacteriaceae bacterium]|nr:Plug domain-containing protein [Cyclobacteriaceae bacterium]
MLNKLKALFVLLFIASQGFAQSFDEDSIWVKELEEIVISGTRAGVNTPVTYQNIKKEEIELRNLGQDMPYILSASPSLVYTSDAGTGIGYTGMRIRGSDATRINVTINGIPYNDSESQGTFWVDLPDFSSSVNSIQIQRGVGTSTNGSGAFGASVNLETNLYTKDAFVEFNNSFGSFGTRKHNIVL